MFLEFLQERQQLLSLRARQTCDQVEFTSQGVICKSEVELVIDWNHHMQIRKFIPLYNDWFVCFSSPDFNVTAYNQTFYYCRFMLYPPTLVFSLDSPFITKIEYGVFTFLIHSDDADKILARLKCKF